MTKPIIILLGTLILLLAYSGYEYLRIKALAKISGQLVIASKPFEQHPQGANYKILVLGDSTGVGTGTSDTKYSLAGRLGQSKPQADVTNLSQNGLRTAGLLNQINQLPNDKYDFILIHIGGNDLIRLQNLAKSSQNIRGILTQASVRATQVAIFTTGNLGEADFFPYVAKPLYTHRAKTLRNRVKAMAGEFNNVTYVDLFNYPKSLPEVGGYAADKLHLNDSGYLLWQQALEAALQPKN